MKFIISCLAFFFFISLKSQNTYSVDNKPGAAADFSNLQDAIDAVPAGSTLLVQGSVSDYSSSGAQNPRPNSRVEINKEVHITGPGYYLDQNPNTQSFQTTARIYEFKLDQGADYTSISGVSVRYSTYIADIQNINISHIVSGGAIFVSDSHNIHVSKSITALNIQDNISSNITLIGSKGYINGGIPSTFSIINCVDTVLRSGMTAYNNIVGSSSFVNNDPNIYNNIVIHPGSCNNSNCGNTYFYIDSNNNKRVYVGEPDYQEIYIDSTDPRYSSDGRYILGAGSPAIGAGVNGIDCGMFGGGYRLSGIPNIPNIYEFTVPDTGYTNDGGIPVTIKVRANN